MLLEEIGLIEQLAKAQAAVDRADGLLDRFVNRASNAVDEHTGGPTQRQLRKALLKGKAPSRFRRPVLGRQLLDMADWSEILAKSGVPALEAMAPEAAALVTAGNAADTLRTAAQSANRTFRDVGARRQYIDAVNASRREIEGALAKLPFESPALPQDFSEGFFYKEPPREEDETLDDVRAAIDDLTAQLAERKKQLEQLEHDAALAAQAEAERRAHEQEAETLEEQARALLAQAAAKREKLKK
ncbi:Hypothetical protein A7982_03426 [Minicystis rosea]|nr:Hypothetical protein A7982_03426 [Minicystis rosea]